MAQLALSSSAAGCGCAATVGNAEGVDRDLMEDTLNEAMANLLPTLLTRGHGERSWWRLWHSSAASARCGATHHRRPDLPLHPSGPVRRRRRCRQRTLPARARRSPKGWPSRSRMYRVTLQTIGERPSWTFPCIRPRRASSFYLVDRASGRVLQTFSVAHGQGSEGSRQSYAEVFSNIPDTNASSLGLYRTAETYVSEAFAGPAMRMAGSRRRTRTPDRDSSSSTALGIWSRSRGKASGQGDQG